MAERSELLEIIDLVGVNELEGTVTVLGRSSTHSYRIVHRLPNYEIIDENYSEITLEKQNRLFI